MVGIEGEYYYTESGLGLVCGTYFLAEPDEIVEVEIIEFGTNCADGQLEVSKQNINLMTNYQKHYGALTYINHTLNGQINHLDSWNFSKAAE